MPKGLFVDYGGVLTSPIADSFAAFCTTEGIDVEEFRRVVIEAVRTPDSPFARVETGALSQPEFNASIAALVRDGCGVAVDALDLKDRMFSAIRPDLEMIEALRAARAAGIRTALVSNSWGGSGYPRDLFAELFDVTLISGEIGMRKPNADIFLFACEQAGVEPDSCVFVDDIRTNVEGAEAVGMTGIWHRTSDETIPRLEELFGIPMRG
jgi:epoxide hydrolase-like predicted phosphatase